MRGVDYIFPSNNTYSTCTHKACTHNTYIYPIGQVGGKKKKKKQRYKDKEQSGGGVIVRWKKEKIE